MGTTSKGRPCRREAAPGTEYCAAHVPDPVRGDGIYEGGFEPDELVAFAVAGTLEGVESEIAVLRVLIRRCLTAGDVGEARRSIEGLGRLLRIQRELTADQVGQLETSFNRVLDVLGAELEVAL